MGNIVGFWIGFIAGFFANWVFAMVGRLLPPTWVRYEVTIGLAKLNSSQIGEEWMVSVRISPPRWKKALMDALVEYLIVDVQINGKLYQSKWATGDLSEVRLRADGAMTVDCFMLSRLGHGGNWCIADQYSEPSLMLSTMPSEVAIRITRSLDKTVADEKVFSAINVNGQISQFI